MKQQVIELPNFFSNKANKRFVLNDESLIMMDDSKPDSYVEIPIGNIRSFRFGINWIKGLYVSFGRQYLIEIKDNDDYIVPIKFYSYYGLRRGVYNEIYIQLIKAIWEHYFLQQARHYLNLYDLNLPIEINKLIINKTGIEWQDNSINWNELAISNYITYFVLHNKNNAKINKSFNFKNDWDAYLLQSIIITLMPGDIQAI